MKRILVTAAVLAVGAGTAGVSLAGTADGQGAQRRALAPVTTDADGQCEEAGSDNATTGAGTGFVILNAPGKVGATTRVIGEVSLKKAASKNSVFTVFLAQDGKCTSVGTLTTNGQGNGNSHIDGVGTAGSYYVVLQDMSMKERYASFPATLK